MVHARDLPIEPLLGEICGQLKAHRRLVLAAPPGAGKTTRVPLALAGLIDGFEALPGRIVMLEPRRLAARMAADRMAATLGEKTGGQIGLSTRIERKVSKDTLVEVVQMSAGIMTVYQGQSRTTLSCAPTCQPVVMMGDDTGYSGRVLASSQLVQSAAN